MALSAPVSSRQTGIHPELERVLDRHRRHAWRAPLRTHNLLAWQRLQAALPRSPVPVVLDSGCGTGASSRQLATLWPDHLIIGIDKSAARLNTDSLYQCAERVLLLRADVEDIWRLMLAANWPVERHYLLYPNPWPKVAHLRRRWHAHPAFPVLLDLSPHLEMRTNWRLYADEFSRALQHFGHAYTHTSISPKDPLTPFEAKYQRSGHSLYRVTTNTG